MIGTFDHNVASPGGPAQGGPRLSVLGLIASLLWPVTVAVADAVPIVAGGGDLEQQRLAAGASCGLQHIDHMAGFMSMQLVDDRTMDVEAVHGAGIG
jgi:hypothetical protein